MVDEIIQFWVPFAVDLLSFVAGLSLLLLLKPVAACVHVAYLLSLHVVVPDAAGLGFISFRKWLEIYW